MRYKELLSEEQLDELRMNPRSLQQFAVSDEAKGIMAGFEAELVFTGLGGEADYDEDPEPDYDADERCRSIDDVINFFSNDEYGYATYGRDLDNLQEGLDEKYMEWHDEQMYNSWRDQRDDLIKEAWLKERPMTERIHAALADGLELSDDKADAIIVLHARRERGEIKGSEMSDAELEMASQYSEAMSIAEDILNEDVEQTIEKEDGFYDEVLDEFRNDFYVDDDSGFFGDVGLRWMSDVANEFQLMWPVITYTGQSSEGGWNQDEAERLADDLHEKLGVKTKVSGGYHSATRDDETWIFEPDSSLDADDSDNMPVEIVSPPMPLLDCLRQMENFFTWAEENGAYANSSTGFHMGVSLPHRGGAVDYVKLALFLGDEYVLKEFGRSSNHFCEAAMKKIRQRVKGNKEAIGGALDLMRSNLIELAQKALEVNNHGFGKYTSINPQGGNDSTRPEKERGAKYIEFRSAGGTNYFEDIDKLKNTLLRYARSMEIAGNPAAERKEYYKKLYKLISPPEGDPAIDLFARFATGEISSEELKKSWADKQLEKEPKGDWKLWDANGKAVVGQEYNGYTKSEAWERAHKKISPGGSIEGFKKEYRLLPMRSATGDWEVYDVKTGETLEILNGFENKGAAADSVYDKYVSQGIGFNLRPADPEAPEKPLSQREKLAKNIKQAPPEEEGMYQIINKRTGEIIDAGIRGRKSSLGKYLRNYEKEHNIPQGDLIVKLSPDQDTKQTWIVSSRGDSHIEEVQANDEAEAIKLARQQHEMWEHRSDIDLTAVLSTEQNNVRLVPRKWEFYRTETGNVIDTVDDIDMMQAEAVRRDIVRRYGHEDTSVGKRSVPTQASAERVRNRQGPEEPEPDYSQPPEGFMTQRPEYGDYYEIRGNSDNRIYGYIKGVDGRGADGNDLARKAKYYVNNLTGRDDAFVQYRAGDPVQARAENGVPMWEVYERDSGHVVHTFADHTSNSAWATAQTWLQNIGAEDPSLFSCRPKMSA